MNSRVWAKLPFSRAFVAESALALTLLSCGCTKRQEEIRVATALPSPTAAEIDQDPFRLLPPGAVAFLRFDEQVWAAEFGDDLARTMMQYLPFSQGAGLSPQTDIQLVVGAVYATVQNDVVFVGQGQFDRARVKAAVQAEPQTQLGRAIRAVEFAGQTMYVTDQAALAILTPKTAIFGTQLGVRRVLEVVEERRMKRQLPEWFEALLKQKGAQLQIGVDLDAEAVPAVLRTRLEFLNHLRAARLVGNYQGGGLNLAGSLTFDTPQAAKEAELQIDSAEDELDKYRMVMNALAMPSPFRQIEAQAVGKDAQFAVEVEGDAISFLLTKGSGVLDQFLTEGP